MVKISSSILSANLGRLSQEIIDIDEAGTDYIHFDVMDGIFVPNITFGVPVLEAIRNDTKKIFDVHLMVDKPENLIQSFAGAGADIITIHAESTVHLDRALSMIRASEKKVGVSIVPSTPTNILNYVMDKVDLILIMTVNPGFGGQKFLESQLNKIKLVREKIDNSGFDIELEIDGGVDFSNASMLSRYGIDVFVSGSTVFKGGVQKYKSNIKKLRELLNG